MTTTINHLDDTCLHAGAIDDFGFAKPEAGNQIRSSIYAPNCLQRVVPSGHAGSSAREPDMAGRRHEAFVIRHKCLQCLMRN